MAKPLVSIAFKSGVPTSGSIRVLAGDIGGTKTNMALYRSDSEGLTLLREKRYVSKDHKSLEEIVSDFTGGEKPDRISAAVAGPVLKGKSRLTNLSWELDSEALGESLGIPVSFINDLVATAYGLAGLRPEELAPIAPGEAGAEGNIAIIAPGTGLGEAGLYWDGERYHPFATEGGHSDFFPRTEIDIEIFRWLQQQYGHVSFERVVSGMGIKNLYRFFTEVRNVEVPGWMQERLKTEDAAAIISDAAMKKEDPVCAEVMELFVRYLASESSSLVLKTMATGGLFLAGGIPPKILPLLQSSSWSANFDNSGRMHRLSEKVPIQAVLNDKMALLGAAHHGAYNM
jgi:glucokinase